MTDRDRATGQLWAGLVLIALGVLFLLDRFHVLAFAWIFREWWPSLLILLGAVQLVTCRGRRWTGPLVLITLGVIFQVQNLGWFYWWRMRNLWPAILIAVGVGVLIRRMQHRGDWHSSNRIEAKS